MSDNPENVRIHFAWVDYGIEEKRILREKLIKASESERLEIIKHRTLYNTFLLKRLKNFTFSNIVYFKILNDPNIQKIIIPKLYNIITNRVLYKKELEEKISGDVLRAYPSFDIESIDIVLQKSAMTNRDALVYLNKKLDYYLEKGETDYIIATRSLLKEYAPPSIFTISDLFTDRFLAKYSIHPLKYNKYYNNYAMTELYNFTLYNILNNPQYFFFPLKFRQKFANLLSNKLINFVFKNLGLEPSIENFIQYSPLFNHLLSIASSIYFKNLSLEKKLNFINSELKIDEFIDMIKEIEVKEDYEIWRKAATDFNLNGAPEYALKIMNILERKWFKYVKDEDKFQFFDTLATINRNLGFYESAKNYYKKALKWIEKSNPYLIRIPGTIQALVENKQIENSLEYRKAVCLKNIGESYGHLENIDKQNYYFEKVIEIIDEIQDIKEKFSLYVNIAVAYRRLYDYEKERHYLNLSLDFLDDTFSIENINNIERRIEDFVDSEMDTQKLKEYELDATINQAIFNGKLLQNSFFFADSIYFYIKALNLIKDNNIRRDTSEILVEIGFSHLYLHNWSNSEEYFKESLEIKEKLEIKTYLIISLIKLNKNEDAKIIFGEIKYIFNEPTDMVVTRYGKWLTDVLNYLKTDEITTFIGFIDLLDHKLCKYNFISSIATVSAKHGFSDLAIDLYKKAIDLSPDNEFISSNYNNIGTVYLEQDDYDKAIKFFKKAYDIYKDGYFCLINIVNAYGQKLEFENAKIYQKEAIEVLKRINAPKELINLREEELEYIDSLLADILNIDRVNIEEVRGFLITAESFYLDYQNKEEPFDFSPIVTEFSKALERILHDKISIKFNPLINKYKQKYKNRKTSRDFHIKFGNLFRGKTISLGIWAIIFEVFEKQNINTDFKEFKQILFNKYDKNTREIFANACKEISPERNPLSHYKSLKMIDVINLRKKMINHLNSVINQLF